MAATVQVTLIFDLAPSPAPAGEVHARSVAGIRQVRVHDDAGIVIVGGFPRPVTGRSARIAAARELVRRESDNHQQAEEKLEAAKQHVTAIERRQKGARAAAEAGRLDGQISGLRKKDQAARDERAKLAPTLSAAQAERDEVLRLAGVRQLQSESLQREKTTLDTTNKTRRQTRENLETEQSQLGLPALAAQWDGTPDSASEHLLALPDNQQSWTADDWWEEPRDLITAAVSECFPPTASASMPTEITGLLAEFSQRGPGSSLRAQAAFAPLRPRTPRVPAPSGRYRPVRAPADRRSARGTPQEPRRRADRPRGGGPGQPGLPGALTSAIKKKLADVGAEFDRLDRTYGGYGASLQYDEPPPPADPTEAWDWKVTPMWRRAEGRRLIPYDRRANTAQIDDRAIKLVCAAAAASGTPAGPRSGQARSQPRQAAPPRGGRPARADRQGQRHHRSRGTVQWSLRSTFFMRS
jgi:hypothetical protein